MCFNMITLVTGTPGSGKTTLVTYAHSVGDATFIDADELLGLCEWIEFKTGTVLGLITEHPETGKDDWYARYGWYWRPDFLEQYLAEHPNVVMCGSAENTAESYSCFDKIFILRKTEEVLISNLASPDRINPFGKTPEQRKNLLTWQDYLIGEAESYNHFIFEGNDIGTTYALIKEGQK